MCNKATKTELGVEEACTEFLCFISLSERFSSRTPSTKYIENVRRNPLSAPCIDSESPAALLPFSTIKVQWAKLAFLAALGSGSDTSTHPAARFGRAPNSGSGAGSNFPEVPPPRCASQTPDPLRFRLVVVLLREPTSTLRQPAEPPPLHP